MLLCLSIDIRWNLVFLLQVFLNPNLVKVEVGSTLHLDCPVTHLTDMPGNIMLWKKGHRVLTAGSMKVRRDPRMELLNTDLKISKIGVHDGGMYRCEIEQRNQDKPLAVVHTVEILGMLLDYKMQQMIQSSSSSATKCAARTSKWRDHS